MSAEWLDVKTQIVLVALDIWLYLLVAAGPGALLAMPCTILKSTTHDRLCTQEVPGTWSLLICIAVLVSEVLYR
eukprot:3131592-Amphidinium_carterae.1